MLETASRPPEEVAVVADEVGESSSLGAPLPTVCGEEVRVASDGAEQPLLREVPELSPAPSHFSSESQCLFHSGCLVCSLLWALGGALQIRLEMVPVMFR